MGGSMGAVRVGFSRGGGWLDMFLRGRNSHQGKQRGSKTNGFQHDKFK